MGYGVEEWTPDASEEGMRVNVDLNIYTFYDSSVVLFFSTKCYRSIQLFNRSKEGQDLENGTSMPMTLTFERLNGRTAQSEVSPAYIERSYPQNKAKNYRYLDLILSNEASKS